MNVDALSKPQILKLLAAAHAYKQEHWLAVLVGYLHALRASEVIAIKRDDIREGFLTVQRGKKSRRTVQALLEGPHWLISERKPLIEYASFLGPNQRLFNFTRQTFYNVLRRSGEAAGIPERQCHPHILKRTCLTEIIAKHGLPAAQAWGGHVSGGSTLIYTTMSQADAARAALESLCL